MMAGIEPDIRSSPYWTTAEAYLSAASRLGGGVPVLEEGEQCWAFYDWRFNGINAPSFELLGCATTRLTEDAAEIILVGGRDHRRWIGAFEDLVMCWAEDEGARRLIATGRPGWKRILKDWSVIGERDGFVRYERVI